MTVTKITGNFKFSLLTFISVSHMVLYTAVERVLVMSWVGLFSAMDGLEWKNPPFSDFRPRNLNKIEQYLEISLSEIERYAMK